MTAAMQISQTTEIINEFVQLIENDKEYELKELKQMLADIYKTKTVKKKVQKTVSIQPTADSEESDEEKPKKRGRPAKVNNKPKRPASAYNNFVKERIMQLKIEQTGKTEPLPAKELMKVAAGEWKTLTKEQQESYKL
jgi:hypothetical protein